MVMTKVIIERYQASANEKKLPMAGGGMQLVLALYLSQTIEWEEPFVHTLWTGCSQLSWFKFLDQVMAFGQTMDWNYTIVSADEFNNSFYDLLSHGRRNSKLAFVPSSPTSTIIPLNHKRTALDNHGRPPSSPTLPPPSALRQFGIDMSPANIAFGQRTSNDSYRSASSSKRPSKKRLAGAKTTPPPPLTSSTNRPPTKASAPPPGTHIRDSNGKSSSSNSSSRSSSRHRSFSQSIESALLSMGSKLSKLNPMLSSNNNTNNTQNNNTNEERQILPPRPTLKKSSNSLSTMNVENLPSIPQKGRFARRASAFAAVSSQPGEILKPGPQQRVSFHDRDIDSVNRQPPSVKAGYLGAIAPRRRSVK